MKEEGGRRGREEEEGRRKMREKLLVILTIIGIHIELIIIINKVINDHWVGHLAISSHDIKGDQRKTNISLRKDRRYQEITDIGLHLSIYQN